jgi:hypothetical protein
VFVGLPPPEDRGFADVWSALGGELKPSLDVVVVAPALTGVALGIGPPVGDEGLHLDLGDRTGGPGDEGRRRHRPPEATDRTSVPRPSAGPAPTTAEPSPRPRARRRRT